MSLDSKVFAVTAGGQGIGLAIARVLASRGASLSLADINGETLAQVKAEFEANKWPVTVTTLDVRDAGQVNSWIEHTVHTFGRLDGAANVVGVIGRQFGKAAVTEIEDEDWNFVLGVNVTGTMNSLRAELRHLADGGSIVNISSNLGSRGEAGGSAYVTSKHALTGLTRCAAKDFAHRGIRVNTVAPGPTKTPLFHSQVKGNPPPPDAILGRFGEPDEVAYLIAWLLGPESTYVTGELYRIDGGEFC
ncbi:hypothetical protein F66182_4137 [Fusarium sp. NRRL 66182]|nr:hypothetical protein F66182_4137 [Fusarium sp. NRRL 66182]